MDSSPATRSNLLFPPYLIRDCSKSDRPTRAHLFVFAAFISTRMKVSYASLPQKLKLREVSQSNISKTSNVRLPLNISHNI